MALIVELKVVPQSGRQELVLDKSGILKCFIKSPPEDGKANKEIIQLIAQKLDIRKSDIEIVSGLTSRKKRLALGVSLTYQQFLERVGLEHQSKLFEG